MCFLARMSLKEKPAITHTVVLNVNPSIMDRHDKGRNVKQLILRHLVSNMKKNTVNQSFNIKSIHTFCIPS